MPHRTHEVLRWSIKALVCTALWGCMPEGTDPPPPASSNVPEVGGARADAAPPPAQQQPQQQPQQQQRPPQQRRSSPPQQPPPPQEAASGDPCEAATLGDGYYCARSLDPASQAPLLYGCAGQRTFSVVGCPHGCEVMPPGTNDACAAAPSALPAPLAEDLCAAADLGDGDYCAASLDPASKSSNLYSCAGRRISSVTACPHGCQQHEPGINDVCASAPPAPPAVSSDLCAEAALGDGDYCAESLDPASKSSRLYTCVGRQTATVVTCPAGCQVNAPGIDDTCTAAPTTPIGLADPCSRAALGDGDYCAESLDPMSTDATLYTCVGQRTTKLVQCPSGCRLMPPGTNDVCVSVAAPPPACAADAAFACGGSSSWCYAGQCNLCTQGYFNCNGRYGCECKHGCFGLGCLQCRSDAAFSCEGDATWCYQGQCRQCTASMFNCDGKDGCECAGGCDGTKCKKSS